MDVEVHHVRSRNQGGSNHPHNLVTPCGTCHASVHRSFLRLFDNPEHEFRFTSGTGEPIHRGGHPPPARLAGTHQPPTSDQRRNAEAQPD